MVTTTLTARSYFTIETVTLGASRYITMETAILETSRYITMETLPSDARHVIHRSSTLMSLSSPWKVLCFTVGS